MSLYVIQIYARWAWHTNLERVNVNDKTVITVKNRIAALDKSRMDFLDKSDIVSIKCLNE